MHFNYRLSTATTEMKCVVLLAILYGVLGVPVEDEVFQEFVNGNHKFTADVYKVNLSSVDNFIVKSLVKIVTPYFFKAGNITNKVVSSK